MEKIYAVVLIVIGFLFLIKGADSFVSNASQIAKKLGISPLVIGLTIVAFGTSLPELAVSVSAALKGANEIAVGNVVGSNIFNLLVVAGSSACFSPLVTDRQMMKRDWPLSAFAAGLLLVFLLTGLNITRIEALILLIFFAITLYAQIKSGKQETEEISEETKKMSVLLLFLAIGIVGIVIGGQLAVEGATSLARIFGWSETLIGLTIVAVGTSLPELVTSIVAAKKGENEIAMGNVIGSNLFNIFCILGVSAFLHPISVEATAVIDVSFLIVVTVVFWLLAKKCKMDYKFGIAMMLTYTVYMIYIILR